MTRGPNIVGRIEHRAKVCLCQATRVLSDDRLVLVFLSDYRLVLVLVLGMSELATDRCHQDPSGVVVGGGKIQDN